MNSNLHVQFIMDLPGCSPTVSQGKASCTSCEFLGMSRTRIKAHTHTHHVPWFQGFVWISCNLPVGPTMQEQVQKEASLYSRATLICPFSVAALLQRAASCGRDPLACKAWTVHQLALYRNSLLSSVLSHCFLTSLDWYFHQSRITGKPLRRSKYSFGKLNK